MLRGGMDFLSVVVPRNDANYASARPSIAVPGTALLEAVALENGAERCRNGNAPLGVDLVDECRDKAVHSFSRSPVVHASHDNRD